MKMPLHMYIPVIELGPECGFNIIGAKNITGK